MRALAEGQTLETFRKGLAPRLRKLGWAPPTGVDSIPHRLRTIYNANMRSARSAGHWHTIEETKESFPYLLYSLGPSKVHRDWHVRWAGTLLPVDDPWWDTHFPPNGWGCKCWVRQVSRRQQARLKDAGAHTTAPPLEMETWIHPTTGRTARVPKGINPGWEWNAGKHRELGVRMAFADHIEKLLKVNSAGRGEAITRARIAEDLGGAGFALIYKKQKAVGESERTKPLPKKQDQLRVPVGVIPDDLQADMGTRRPVLSLSGYTIGKQKASHPEVKPADYAMVQRILDGDRILPQSDTHRIGFAQDDEGKWWAAAWKRTQDDGEALLLNLHRTTARRVPDTANR